jgi:hypothetical protein
MDTPYRLHTKCVQRLLTEYRTHKSLIVACDFDDTVYDFHSKGHTYDKVFRLLRNCRDLGFHIVLFTGSNPDQYEMQKRFMLDEGILIKHINENPIPLPFGNHGKMYYNVLLDDRAGLGQSIAVLEQVIEDIKMEKN